MEVYRPRPTDQKRHTCALPMPMHVWLRVQAEAKRDGVSAAEWIRRVIKDRLEETY